MGSLPCWQTRLDCDPRYDYAGDAFDDTAPLWSPNCGHDVCMAEDRLHERESCSENGTAECPQVVCRFATSHAMCQLDQGHQGGHDFVPENEIVLYFVSDSPAPCPAGGRL